VNAIMVQYSVAVKYPGKTAIGVARNSLKAIINTKRMGHRPRDKITQMLFCVIFLHHIDDERYNEYVRCVALVLQSNISRYVVTT